MGDELVALPLEGGHPFVDRRGPQPGMTGIATSTLNVRDIEEVVELLIGQLD